MRSLRSTWRLRAVALLLVVSVLPMTFVWPQQSTTPTPAKAHADWLRAQVNMEMDETGQEAFESALREAVEEEAHSLQDFLYHFVAAYAQQGEGPSLAQLFGVEEGSHEQVADELQRRLAQVSGWATIPRLAMAFKAFTSSSPRGVVDAVTVPEMRVFVAFRDVAISFVYEPAGDILVRTLSASRPRAP